MLPLPNCMMFPGVNMTNFPIPASLQSDTISIPPPLEPPVKPKPPKRKKRKADSDDESWGMTIRKRPKRKRKPTQYYDDLDSDFFD